MRRKQRSLGRGGFTLLEMMFALVILAGGLLAMLMMQTQALQQGRYGRHSTDAMQVARDQMEFFMRLPWGAAAVQPVGWTAPAPLGMNVQSDGGTQTQQVFNVNWRITAAPFDANLRIIEVNVNWAEGDANGFVRNFLLASNKNNES